MIAVNDRLYAYCRSFEDFMKETHFDELAEIIEIFRNDLVLQNVDDHLKALIRMLDIEG